MSRLDAERGGSPTGSPTHVAGAERWFVYYKLPASEAPACTEAARALLRRVAQCTAIHGRLLRKCDEAAGTTTLMEIYEPVIDTRRFADELAAAVAASALPSALHQARRVERFVDA